MIRNLTLGKVVDNDDPSKAGGIKCTLAEVGGQVYPVWFRPVMLGNTFFVPRIDDTVLVAIPTGEDLIEFSNDVFYFGVIRGRGEIVDDEHKTNYPNRQGWKTKSGHYLYIDDDPDNLEITLSHNNKILFSMNKDGMFLGRSESDEPFVLGNQFQTLLSSVLGQVSSLATTLASHIHTGVTTGMSVSGTPLPTDIAAFDAVKTSINSSKTTVDNGDQLSDYIFGSKDKP